MCGIIGIIAKKPVAYELVGALKRLEYRGYDSAGIATLVEGRIERRRAEGKLAKLADRLALEPIAGTTGLPGYGFMQFSPSGLPVLKAESWSYGGIS